MAADDIARLYTFVSGTAISSPDHNAEHDLFVTTANNKGGRSVDNTWSGTNTFSHASTPIKTDIVTERTAGSGITIDGLQALDGALVFGSTAGYSSTADGAMGYDPTADTYVGQENSVDVTFITTGQLATQADMESSTKNTVAVPPLTMHHHPGVAKAWVAFTSTGTVTVKNSYNMDSSTPITDTAVGRFTANFDTDFSTGNHAGRYAFSGAASDGASGALVISHAAGANVAATAHAFEVRDLSNTLKDADHICLVYFGDH